MADKESVVRQTSEYTDIMEKNHMEIPWHDYAKADSNSFWRSKSNFAV